MLPREKPPTKQTFAHGWGRNCVVLVDKDWLKDFDDDKDAKENTWRYWRQYSL